MMKNILKYLFFIALIGISQVKAKDEILNILNTANDLTLQEVNALWPLFNEFQNQYDAITKALANEGATDIVQWQKEAFFDGIGINVDEYVSLMQNLITLPETPEINELKYDTKLPALAELLKDADVDTADMTKEQLAELSDLEDLMQDTLDEAQLGLNELVRRALHIESEMLKLNKPKIAMYVYKVLSIIFRYSSQLRRAAYCVYSHVPQLNDTLQNLNDGVACYGYTKQLVAKVEREVVQTVGVIKKNVNDLAKVYKRIAAKNSIVGKIVTAVLNIFKIIRDVRETLAAATKAIDGLENQLPSAAIKSVHCGTDFVEALPQMVGTVVNVTTCVTFVDNSKEEYEFLLPEAERDLKLCDAENCVS